MPTPPTSAPIPTSELDRNIVYFARVLRDAGIRLGPSKVVDAVSAVSQFGLLSRDDLYWTLHSLFLMRREDHDTFDEAFRLFWKPRDFHEKLLSLFSPTIPNPEDERASPSQVRVSQALLGSQSPKSDEVEEEEMVSSFSGSAQEVLKKKDFAQMTAQELLQARHSISRLIPSWKQVRTRRFRPTGTSLSSGKKFDGRSSLKHSMTGGGQFLLPHFQTPRVTDPPLVILADISGSMSSYSRIFLHFLHAMSVHRRHIHTFLFGTRLTNITCALRHKDPDRALDDVSTLVPDWEGGTLIGEVLYSFNKLWSRRVLGQGAIVLFISDGLERSSKSADLERLVSETQRLRRSCRKLIWLNPLLRFDGFEPKASGIQAILPHVDEFRPIHSLESLEDLCMAITNTSGRSRYVV